MSKTTGIVQRLFVNQFDLSGDVGAINVAQHTKNQQDVTTLLDRALERLSLLRDGSLNYTAFFDTAAGQEHPVLRGLPQSAIVTWTMKYAVGGPACSLIANHTDYGTVRGQDGSLVLTPQAVANGYGLQWGNLLTNGLQTFASAAASTAIDEYVPVFATLPLPSVNGFAAYLHAISIGSGTATVAIQDSSDNLSFANVTGGGFTAISAATSERIQSGATQALKRYVRINVSGTFTNLVVAVVLVRYITGFGMN